jgi:hypothetical protein
MSACIQLWHGTVVYDSRCVGAWVEQNKGRHFHEKPEVVKKEAKTSVPDSTVIDLRTAQ